MEQLILIFSRCHQQSVSWSDFSTCSCMQTISTNTVQSCLIAESVCSACLGIMLKYKIYRLDLLSSKHYILEGMNSTHIDTAILITSHPIWGDDMTQSKSQANQLALIGVEEYGMWGNSRSVSFIKFMVGKKFTGIVKFSFSKTGECSELRLVQERWER